MEKVITESNGFKLTLDKINDGKIMLGVDCKRPYRHYLNKMGISMSKRQVLKLINELQEIIKNVEE